MGDNWLEEEDEEPSDGSPAASGVERSPRMSELLSAVLRKLRLIIDPDLRKDIVSLQFIKNLSISYELGSVSFDLCLTTPACPIKSEFVSLCEKRVKELPWVKSVLPNVCYPHATTASTTDSSPFDRISYILAVSSCKGGVGKSSMAVNLAFMLRFLGAKVGLVDADVYGPSLPVLLPLEDAFVYFKTKSSQKDTPSKSSDTRRTPHLDLPIGIPSERKPSIDISHSTAQISKALHHSSSSSPTNHGDVRTQTGNVSAKIGRPHSSALEYENFDVSETTPSFSFSKDPSFKKDRRKPSPDKTEEDKILGMIPLEHLGVKLMSCGYLKQKGSQGYTGIRGPLASGLVTQMITGTCWGDLDYLIIDLPPGTGDIHLTLGQSIPLTAAIVVTTPQSLSVVDVERGIRLFNHMHVPTIALIENMAYFLCDNCDTKHEIFAKSSLPTLVERYGVGHHIQIPLHPDLSQCVFPPLLIPSSSLSMTPNTASSMSANKKSHEETLQEDLYRREKAAYAEVSQTIASSASQSSSLCFPYVAAHDEHSMLWRLFLHLAQVVAREAATVKFANVAPYVALTEDGFIEMIIKKALPSSNHLSEEEGFSLSEEILITPCREVRMACRCAECIDECTGERRQNLSSVDSNVKATSLTQTGTYAVSIECDIDAACVAMSDGHQSIVSFDALEKTCRQQSKNLTSQAISGCLSIPELDW
ncbi:ATP-binding Mrp/Nbp35 family protein [Cardiosporidium cionae]|uniref:ATP-binding Mrp/Nbp35 family protein n=1 Tax=Cardiosporidium cionae TaxID=476202 RepID=A0ABQ7JDV8_9APIC|nr:ATP-binding Mrp/Nbp35 family protein [Cardiosporidium cionae]|eukprot:KAF8822138.1 ATP-binding Mrp/Nbp35 family protein [Cardiosporidium cionae]